MPLTLPVVLSARYELLEEIGQGGHATVYRARDRALDRDVAVKLLRDDALTADALLRFRQEVQVTAHLEHAHILHVYDTGELDGCPYIVMELATGRTLRDKLAREGQLPIADALQIARDVGMALAHAHSRGVIHRDVKPENILLGTGGALLADFGIARLSTEELARAITSTGTVVGTVQYMSPEQLCADPQIDARTDQYSLACVLYEMLAGVRPHIAATFDGLRLLRISAQQVPVTTHRPRVMGSISDALAVALASAPADRFRTMEEFLAALGIAGSGEFASVQALQPASGSHLAAAAGQNARPQDVAIASGSAAPTHPPRRIGWVAAIAVLAAIGTVAALNRPRPTAGGTRARGQLAVVLLGQPPRADSASVSARVHDAIRAELSSWEDIRVVTDAADASPADSALTITPSVIAIADSFRIQLDARVLREPSGSPAYTMTSASGLAAPASIAASLVRQVLVQHAAPPSLSTEDVPGIEALPGRSLVALQAYVAGFAALRAGHLDSAAQAFRRAARAAPAFTEAEYWSAQSSAWASPRDVGAWASNAEHAERSSLRGMDSLLARGLAHMGRGEFPAACAVYREATNRDARSFVAWYGLGECQRLDPLVVLRPDGYRFRSSHWSALAAYKQAVDHAPTAAWLGALFGPIFRTTYARAGDGRMGHTEGAQRTAMHALPNLDADTIAFAPVSSDETQSMGRRSVPAEMSGALRRGRAAARDLTAQWIRQFPDSPDGWLYRALALELSGFIASQGDGASADEALDRLDALQPSATLRAQIAVARARLALRRGDVTTALEISRRATEDGLASPEDVQSVTAPLAAFLGDVSLATRLSGREKMNASVLPPVVTDSLRAFSLQAMLGSCEGLASRRRELERLFSVSIADAERQVQRQEWLLPAYRLAVPCLGPSVIDGFAAVLPLDFAYQALARNNQLEARRRLANLRAQRSGATFATISWDYLFAESWALVQASDTVAARRQLSGALSDIASMSPYTLDQMPQAAGLRRGILLFAEIAGPDAALRGADKEWVGRAQAFTSTARPTRR